MTKFYNLKVTDFFKKLKDSINKLSRKSDLESKTENLKEESTANLKESSSLNLNDFRNHEAINPNYLQKNIKNKYSRYFYSIFI